MSKLPLEVDKEKSKFSMLLLLLLESRQKVTIANLMATQNTESGIQVAEDRNGTAKPFYLLRISSGVWQCARHSIHII